IHACDLVAIAYQDKFFRDDPYYQARRKVALLVGLDCLEPCEGGFCPTVDAGPFVRPGTADLILQPPSQSGGTWLLLAVSEAGEKSLKGLSLRPGPADWREKRAWQERNAVARFASVPYIREGIHKINQGQVDPKTWESLGTQCFTCSGCTNLCPTCSCFATKDQKTSPASEDFERERCWDSCLFEGFQREASGHNPAVTPGQRVERYWYHKFSNDYLEEFGRYGCVGCGRCERTCIGIIGVHSVMKRLAEQP
ncbi:MAG: 4Fe-4S dicluster domain-containing protein, partial [Bdellovibrionota bacterium]